MIIRDNLTRFSVDLQMSKMPKLIGPEFVCSQISLLSLGEVSDTTNSRRPHEYGLWGSLEHEKLTAIKSAFGHDIIQFTPLCQNNNRPRKSNLYPLFFQNPVVFFWIHKFFSRWHDIWRAKVNSTSLNRNN